MSIVVPNISLPATGEQEINLTNYAGKFIVLYFYPKNNTPGCTTESKHFRDYYDKFQQLNTEIFGVSRDKLTSHEKFKCRHEMPFELIADTDSQLCNHFDVIGKMKFFGKSITSITRSTFLIGPDGKVIQEWRKVRVKGHVEQVLEAVKVQSITV